jgi:hypothetical protein
LTQDTGLFSITGHAARAKEMALGASPPNPSVMVWLRNFLK